MRLSSRRIAPWTRAVVALAALAVLTTTHRHAVACTGAPIIEGAIPRHGATGVPTDVRIVVIGPTVGTRAVTAGTKAIPITNEEPLGYGYDATLNGPGFVVRLTLASALPPSTEIVVTNGSTELTRFTTGTGPSTATALAPSATSLALWQVDYPSDQSFTTCVQAPTYGFLTDAYVPATIDDTPADSVVHVLTLEGSGDPQAGTDTLQFAYVGATPYVGRSPIPDDQIASTDRWHPEIDATTSYCLRVHAYGYARDVPSNDATPPCAIATRRTAVGTPKPVGAPSAAAGGTPAAAPTGNDGGGCSMRAPARSPASGLGLALALMVALTTRARRRETSHACVASSRRPHA